MDHWIEWVSHGFTVSPNQLPKKKAEEAPPAKPKAPPAKPKAEVPEGEHADGAPPSTSKTDKAENTRHAGIIRIFFA